MNKPHHIQRGAWRIALRLPVLSVVMLSLITACAPGNTPQPTLTPESRPTPTPVIPDFEGWSEPSAPLTVENISSLRLLGQLDAPEPPSTVFAHALSPDQSQLAALNNDLLLVWDLIDGELLWSNTRQGANRIYYAPDKESLYTVNSAGDVVVLNVFNGASIDVLIGHDAYSDAAAYHPDSGLLALGGTDGTVKVWDVPSRTARATLATDDSETVSALVFSPDGEILVSATERGTLTVWDWRTRTVSAVVESRLSIVDAHFSPDGRYVAVGSGRALGILDTQAPQEGLRLIQPDGAQVLFGFVPGTPYLLTYEESGAGIVVWDVAEARIASVLTVGAANRWGVAFSPDGRLVFIVSMGGDAPAVWNVSNLAAGAVARGNLTINETRLFATTWTADSFLILTFDALGTIRVWGV